MRDQLGDNLLLLDFKLFHDDPLRMLKAVEEFCGIDSWFADDNFSKARVNSRGRGSANLIARIYKIPGVPFLTRVLPRRVVMSVRSFLETDRGNTKRNEAERPKYSDEQRDTVEALLAQDVEFVARLFEQDPIRTGGA